jgi:predicted acylesterase/phospholipase RssA
MSALDEAERIVSGGSASVQTVCALADELRRSGHPDAVAPLLIVAGRRAIYRRWEPDGRVELAKTLRDHQQFGYARRLLSRVRRDGEDSELLRQQHAFCTYKDAELPAARRLDRALAILGEGGRLIRDSRCAETLGIAGAIFKRRWSVDAKRADLESALWCYRRGSEHTDQKEWTYAAINAAFVSDQLAALEAEGLGPSPQAVALRRSADEIRRDLVAKVVSDGGGWQDAVLGEALFGLERFEEACEPLTRVGTRTQELWRHETTVMQVAAIARLRKFDAPGADDALRALVGDAEGAVRRAYNGKVGLALSGGGFRASLFHIGVLAQLAECNVLRHVEALSCVSGGSIVGAYYYLKLRKLLQDRPDHEITDAEYVELVHALAGEFLDGVRRDVRGRLAEDVTDNWRMLVSHYSRTDRVAELLHESFYSRLAEDPARRVRMDELAVAPAGQNGFSLRYENWRRSAKVPMLILNATTLNTGHNWQFTASWMGEPPSGLRIQVDASRRLRRVYYRDAPGEPPTLDKAVAASACVPALFPPVAFAGVYDGVDVELVDGGVHDNQGIASLLEQDCNVILISDASGQILDAERPKRGLFNVVARSNSVLMSRVRGSQYGDLASRERSGMLRGLMIVHLKMGLPAPPLDWSRCQEPYDSEDDALPLADREGRSPYEIDEDVQRALAQLRTDLDAFSDEEAYALMAAGYRMAERELRETLRDLVTQLPLAPRERWPFADMLARIAADEDGKLAAALVPGRWRFFRRLLAWRHGGAPSSPVPSAAGRAIRTAVVAPVRALVSVPLALAGGIATRLNLRVRGRRGRAKRR